jgi:hypothetical protein
MTGDPPRADQRGLVAQERGARQPSALLPCAPRRRDRGKAATMPRRTDLKKILLIGSGPIVSR